MIIDKFYLALLLVVIVLGLFYAYSRPQVGGYIATCDCIGVPDETLCMQCGNCTWEIDAEGTGVCVPYDNYYAGNYWWNQWNPYNLWNSWNWGWGWPNSYYPSYTPTYVWTSTDNNRGRDHRGSRDNRGDTRGDAKKHLISTGKPQIHKQIV
jgi:hypothetical protein